MKKLLRVMSAAIFLVLVCNGLALASEVKADAVYRDGAFGWDHAGVYDGNGMVYEMPGPWRRCEKITLAEFKNDASSVDGYYGPHYSSYVEANTYLRSYIISICEEIRVDTDISYTGDQQVIGESGAGTWIAPSELTDLRCDGLVEYAYEWNGVDVWGKSNTGDSSGYPTHHDVSYSSYNSEHNAFPPGKYSPWITVSPYIQRGAAGLKWTTLRQR